MSDRMRANDAAGDVSVRPRDIRRCILPRDSGGAEWTTKDFLQKDPRSSAGADAFARAPNGRRT